MFTLDFISLSPLSSQLPIIFQMCPVATVGVWTSNRFSTTPVAFPATLPSYGLLIQLWCGGTVGDRSVFFFFFPLLPKYQFQPFFNYSIVWEVASYQSLMFWGGECDDLVLSSDCGGREDRMAKAE